MSEKMTVWRRDEMLDQARVALVAMDKAGARAVILQVLEEYPAHEAAWVLLGLAVDHRQEKIYCLQQVLRINPRNFSARDRLEELLASPGVARAAPVEPPPPAETPTPPGTSPAPASQFLPAEGATGLPSAVQEAAGAEAPSTSRERRRVEGEEIVPEPALPGAPRQTSTPLVQLAPAPAPIPLRGEGALKEPAPSSREDGAAREREVRQAIPHHARNWSLMVGLGLLLLVVFVAIWGPSLAPRDPLEENRIIRIGNKWQVPPFPFLTQGFPLGSDSFGRDLLSRLLWAVRPTLIMVAIVSIVRLVIGVLIGLLAGWLSGRAGRLLDSLIDAALSVPVLLVALAAIAVVGVELGLWAFVIGLSVTGWVDTAQQVREQTRLVKSQVYIEAAHALGASPRQVLFHHILKQVAPMLVMLFAFEASSSLMTTAGLGFLGYYIGGDVWIAVGDFVAQRVSGAPELGQMLATSWTNLVQPWAMVATGSAVFVTVLGFNLTGEGLRQNLNLNLVRRHGLVGQMQERAAFWLDQTVWHPLATTVARPAVRAALTALVVLPLLGYGGLNLARWLEHRPALRVQARATATQVAKATTPNPAIKPSGPAPTVAIAYSPQVAWEFTDESGFPGGPVLSPDGQTLYAASNAGFLYAFPLNPASPGALKPVWLTTLPSGAAGTPAVAPDGTIFVTDQDAGLTAASPQGQLLWHVKSNAAPRAVSGPAIGPGGIYYTVSDGGSGYIQAVSLKGELLWSAPAKTTFFYRPPDPSPDGKYVTLANDLFDAATGELLVVESPVSILDYFFGSDGKSYLVAGHTLLQWSLSGQQLVLDSKRIPDDLGNVTDAPARAGVLPDGTGWLLFTTSGGDTSMVFVRPDGSQIGQAGAVFSQGELLSVQPDLTAYVCGGDPFKEENAYCAAIQSGHEEPLWQISLKGTGLATGGFWRSGRLFIATSGGKIFAIDPHGTVATLAPTPTAVQAVQPQGPVQWAYPVPEDHWTIQFAPDGTVYILDSHNLLTILGADGVERAKVQLETGPVNISESYDTYPMLPLVLSDSSLVYFSDKNQVVDYSPGGEKKWEATLEFKPIYFPYGVAGSDQFYLMDEKAGLNAFDASGFLWRYQSEAAPYPAKGQKIGPDGTMYYVVTDYSKAWVQAVSPGGQGLWAAEAGTRNIYDDLVVTPDGNYISLSESVFDAHTGTPVQVQFPAGVEEFIQGQDGNAYLRTAHAVSQWRIGPQGVEILHTADWGTGKNSGRPPFMTYIDENSVIWVYFSKQLILFTLDGDILGIDNNPFEYQSVFEYFDETRQVQGHCTQDLAQQVLDCRSFGLNSPDPPLEWQLPIPGVPAITTARFMYGYFYLETESGVMYKVGVK